MPTGRQPDGEHALSNAERKARYRARREAEQPPPKIRYRRPADRRTRSQRWYDTVAVLVALQAEYVGWHDALPDSLRNRATARLRARLNPKKIREAHDEIRLTPKTHTSSGQKTESGGTLCRLLIRPAKPPRQELLCAI
jgi:hypothetical protein